MSDDGASKPTPAKSATEGPPNHGAGDTPAPANWLLSTPSLAVIGGIAMYAAQPPFRLAMLAWVAPIPWLILVMRQQLGVRRPYLWIYFGGVVHWLLMVQGVRHPHPALIAGWIALSLYMAVYVPAFVALSRLAVQRAGWRPVLAAPIVWVGLELARGHVLTGLSLGLLGHAFADWPALIQVANFSGAYGVSFVIMSVATAAAIWLVPSNPAVYSFRWRALLLASLLLAASVAYGVQQLSRPSPATSLKVALIQGGRDVFYEFDPKINQEMYLKYRRNSIDAVSKDASVGLVVWPESSLMSHLPEIVVDGPLVAPDDIQMTDEQYTEAVRREGSAFLARLAVLALDVASVRAEAEAEEVEIPPALMVSGAALHLEGEAMKQYNSTLLVDGEGNVAARYYKMHPVMFGEYIPGGEIAPWIYSLTPMASGLSRGEGPVPMEVQGVTFSPSICFEITVPHLIRRQVARLREQDAMPDVLVNPTNDGWFHGSSILDLHRDCMVFRAVENGRPVLSAANGGMTVWIDERGRVRGELPRKQDSVLVAEVGAGSGVTPYQRVGDLFAVGCLMLTLAAAVHARFR